MGPLTQSIATLAFRSDDTLYAVSGDGGATPETLFILDTGTGAEILAFALGNGADGESIAFHGDSLMYRSSGNATALFESIDVDGQVVTPIGSASGETFAMGYDPESGQLFLSDINNNLHTVDIATGTRTLIGTFTPTLIGSNRGLAFVLVSVPTPTPTPLPVKISLPIDTFDSTVAASTVLIKPVTASFIASSFSYVGFQGDFTYTSSVVGFAAPFVQKAGLTAGNWNVSGNVLGTGSTRTLRISAFSNDFQPLSGTGTLFELRMLRVVASTARTAR